MPLNQLSAQGVYPGGGKQDYKDDQAKAGKQLKGTGGNPYALSLSDSDRMLGTGLGSVQRAREAAIGSRSYPLPPCGGSLECQGIGREVRA